MIIEDWILRVWLIQIGIPALLILILLIYTKVARVVAQVDDNHVVLQTTDKIKYAVIFLWLLTYHINIQLRYVNSASYLSEDFTPFIYISIVSCALLLYIASAWTTKLIFSRSI